MFLFLPLQEAAAFTFSLASGRGLAISVSGVPIVQSSAFQFYEPGWTKGYYSSNNGPQTVRTIDADTQEMAFVSSDKLASGSERVHRLGNTLIAHFHFEWKGPHPAQVEVAPGMLWAPAFQAGTLTADAKPTRPLTVTKYNSDTDMQERRYSPDATNYALATPFANIKLTSSIPTTLFDARGYRQDYAEGKSVWWYGALSLNVSSDHPADLDVTWKIDPTPVAAPAVDSRKIAPVAVAKAVVPDEAIFPEIPKILNAKLNYDKPAKFTNLFTFPAGRVRFWDLFKATLSRRYEVPAALTDAKPIAVDGGVSKLGKRPGAYTIDIGPSTISVLGEEEEGLRNGLYRLARLVYCKNGQLLIPTGHIDDNPQVTFRGVHLFVGSEAREFQKQLWDRVLAPLGLNKVVLECERTAWNSTPLDPSEHPISREELAKIFAYYREIGVEPIPLIQSLGHMDWFFNGKRRLNLAVNPDEPYTLDPRKPETKPATEALWQEAIDLLKPQKIHFGLDEIDQVGMNPHDPELTTNIWQSQLATLGAIAKKNKVTPMIWGDEGLAPGEAVDATNGDTKEFADRRRSAIPQGTMICDWHYAPDPDPSKFDASLQLWKREGFSPIAATWYRPDNVRSFDIASYLERAGTLQTTWAGYESSEKGMIENLDQFTAMVLAADYSWSGRGDAVDKLGYDFRSIFQNLYFGRPAPLHPRAGQAIPFDPAAHSVQIGTLNYSIGAPLPLRSLVSAGRVDGPTSIEIVTAAKGSHVGLAMDTTNQIADGALVAEVSIELTTGEKVQRRLVYGHHLRAKDDPQMTPYAVRNNGICSIEIDLPKLATVRKVSITGAEPVSGVRLYGVTVW